MELMRADRLQIAFETGGDGGWAVWMWGGDEPLERALAPGFFDPVMGRLREGDLILFGQSPRRCYKRGRLERGGTFRRALLVVTSEGRPGSRVELVQSFMGGEARPAEAAPALPPVAQEAARAAPARTAPGRRGRAG